MNGNDNLAQLIKSLSKREKGYFKRYIQKGNKKVNHKYLRLFETIDRDKKPNDNSEIFQYLPERKNYLYNLILKSLRNYNSVHGRMAANVQIFNSALNCIILAKKGIEQAWRKELKKVERLAKLIDREDMVIFVLGNLIGKPEQKNSINISDKMVEYAEKLYNRTQFYQINEKMYDSLIKSSTGNTIYLSIINTLIQNPLLSTEKNAITHDSKFFFYCTHLGYNIFKNDFIKASRYVDKLIVLALQGPIPRTRWVLQSIGMLLELSFRQNDKKKYMEVLKMADELRTKVTYSNKLLHEASIFEFIESQQILFYTNNGNFSKAIELIPPLQNGLRDYAHLLFNNNSLRIYYSIAYAYWGNSDYDDSLDWLNKIFMKFKSSNELRLFRKAKILYLLTQFEIGNQLILPSILGSTQRFLYKQDALHKYENLFLELLKRLNKTVRNVENTKIFQLYQKKLNLLNEETKQQEELHYFDLASWIQSKIDKQPYTEMVKHRADKQV